MLIVFGGLPGTRTTTIARELARQLGAVHLRIDSIEQTLRDCRAGRPSLDDAGYRAAYTVAADNLSIGRIVIADSVNPLPVTRKCLGSDRRTHENGGHGSRDHLLRSRGAPKAHRKACFGHSRIIMPTWRETVSREYHPWDRSYLVVDTARQSVKQSAQTAQTCPDASRGGCGAKRVEYGHGKRGRKSESDLPLLPGQAAH